MEYSWPADKSIIKNARMGSKQMTLHQIKLGSSKIIAEPITLLVFKVYYP